MARTLGGQLRNEWPKPRFGKPPQCYLNKVEGCGRDGLVDRCQDSPRLTNITKPFGFYPKDFSVILVSYESC
jgi:hypothetical protein